mmetsp:Transcript_17968/g.27808  ORF Transcript_17968/g.27808 Transcript_17968/m.27808 type:complete len:211 (+) Transcript_17968:1568-2200(+)
MRFRLPCRNLILGLRLRLRFGLCSLQSCSELRVRLGVWSGKCSQCNQSICCLVPHCGRVCSSAAIPKCFAMPVLLVTLNAGATTFVLAGWAVPPAILPCGACAGVCVGPKMDGQAIRAESVSAVRALACQHANLDVLAEVAILVVLLGLSIPADGGRLLDQGGPSGFRVRLAGLFSLRPLALSCPCDSTLRSSYGCHGGLGCRSRGLRAS